MKMMMILGLVAIAAARIPSLSWEEETFARSELKETSFKKGSEYQFRYNGQVATGIPGASRQHAATRIQALVSMVLKGENKALLKIHQVRMGRLNQELHNPRAMAPFMAFEEVELQEDKQKELLLPVMFNYEKGLISDLVFDGAEKPWSANIKKGILNLLQVNLGKRGQIKQASEASLLNQMPQAETNSKFEFFATQEQTVEGECETLYTVVSNPNSPRHNANVLNVTRSIDFENCKQRPEIKYNFRFQDPCEGCDPKYDDDQKFLRSSSIAKFNISGNREEFLIESAMVESQYQFVPFSRQGNLISTYVNQTLVLIRSGPIVSKDLAQPKNPQQSDSDLVYTLDWDKEMEEFLMKGHNQARVPVELKEQVKMVREVLENILSETRECVSEEAPLLYSRLIKLFRFAEKSQLEQIFAELADSNSGFPQEQKEKVKDILIDALADAGTKDSVSVLLRKFKEGRPPVRAALTIKQLVHIRTPSKEIVREFLSFLEAPIVKENFVLKQAAYLTLGSIVQGLCMPSEERLAILPRPSTDKLPRRVGPHTHLCPQELQDSILEKLFSMVKRGEESEEEIEEAILALKTIGNMGIPKSVIELEKIIRSKPEERKEMIRIEAIIALRQLREVLPQKIQEILMSLFMSKYETNEIRMAAVYQLLQTQPSRPILDQVARKLFAERSHQVASFVYTYMSTLANSTNPCEKNFARDLQLSLRHGRKISGAYLPQFSKVLHGSAHSKNYHLGVDASIISVISNRTFVPRYLAVDLHANAVGFWSKYIASISIAQENVEQLISRFARRVELNDMSLEDILARSTRGAQSPVKELKKIWEKLATVPRSFQQGSPKAFASLKLKDQEFFMIPLTAKSLRQLPSVQMLQRMLQEGAHFNVHKAGNLHEIEYKIPTTIGMPVIVKVEIPTVSQMSGQIRAEKSNGKYELHLNNIKPAMAVTAFTSVTVWSPIVASGIRVSATAKVCAPMSGKVEIDMKTSQPSIRFSVEPVQREVEWIRLETRPATFTRVYRFPLTTYPKAQYKTIAGEQWNRVNNIREWGVVKRAERIVEEVFGQKVRVESVWHRTPFNAPKYLPVCPFSGPNHFSLRTEPGQNTPKEYVLKISAENIKSMSSRLNSEAFEMEEESYLTENYESEGFETTVKTELFTKGSSVEKKAEMESTLRFSPNMRIVKYESVVSVSPMGEAVPRSAKACFTGFIQYPSAAESFAQLSGKAVVASAKASWGLERCSEENKVEVKIGAKHSQRQEEERLEEAEYSYYSEKECREEPERCSPVALEQVLREPQQLLRYTLLAKYSNVPAQIKNATAVLFRALKTYYYWNTNQMLFGHNNPEGLIRAELTVDTKTKQFFNMTIKTPVENVTFTDAELPFPIYTPVSIRRLSSRISSPEDIVENVFGSALPECSINARRVKTFDEATFRAPVSTCWTVLSKDCDDERNPTYAVLIKKLSEETKQKALKIVTQEHTIEMRPESAEYDSIKIKLNGKEVREEDFVSNAEVRMEREGQSLKVILPSAGVRVFFDGYSAQIQVSPLASNTQCGICGHYNGEGQDEYRTATNEETWDARHFIRSYTMKEEKCAYPEELKDISESESLEYQPEWEQEDRYKSSSSESDSKEENKKDSEEDEFNDDSVQRSFRPIRRLAVEEEGSKICVSAEAIPRCPEDSFPSEYEVAEREVQFKCLDRRHPEAHRILRSAHESSKLPQELREIIDTLPNHYTSSLAIPARCSRN